MTTLDIDPHALENIIAVLVREEAALALPRWERVLHRVVDVFIWIAIAALVLVVIIGLAAYSAFFFAKFSIIIDFVWIETIVSSVFLVFSVFSVFLVLTTPCITVATFILGFRGWRRLQLVRKFGAGEVYGVMGKEQTRGEKAIRVCSVIAFVLGVLFVLWASKMLLTEKETQTQVVAALFFFMGATLIAQHFVRQTRQRLAKLTDVRSLKERVNEFRQFSSQSGSEYVAVPTQAVEEIACIEASQIAHSRSQAIAHGALHDTGYAVRTSRDMASAKSALDPLARLQLEDRIEDLAAAPHPEEASVEAGTGRLSLPFPELNQTLVYTVDDVAKRIELIELSSLQPMSTTKGAENG